CAVENFLNSEISVPAANAFSSAPVNTKTLTEESAAAFSQISANCSYIRKVKAFRASGRLKVMRPTPSLNSERISWLMVLRLSWLRLAFEQHREPPFRQSRHRRSLVHAALLACAGPRPARPCAHFPVFPKI